MTTILDGCMSLRLGSDNTIECIKNLARRARSRAIEDMYLV